MWLLAVVVGLLVVAAWVAFRAVQADHALSAARGDVGRIRADVEAADWTALVSDGQALHAHAGAARSATDDPLWRLAGELPWVGRNMRAVGTVSQVLDDTAEDAIVPLLHSQTLGALEKHQTHIPQLTKALDADSALMTRAAVAVNRADMRLQSISTAALWGSVRSGVRAAQEKVAGADADLAHAAELSAVMPDLLGAREPRTILLVFQTPAEARGTGGLVGDWGELQARSGSLSLVKFGPDNELPTLSSYPAGVSPDIAADFGVDPLLPLDANLSASFPDAAQLLSASWTAGPGHGARVDAVVSLDPVALGELLSVLGSVTTADGAAINAGNAADLLLRQQYATYGTDKGPRVAFLGEVTKAVFSRATAGGGYSASALLKQIALAVGEGRLTVWSALPAEEANLGRLGVTGSLGAPDASSARFALYSVDASKLQAYLHTTIDVANCAAGGPVVTATLRSEVPKQPAAYMASHVAGLPPTTMRLVYELYVDPGWGVRAVTVNGAAVAFTADKEGGWRLLRGTVTLPRDASLTIRVALSGGVGGPAPALSVMHVAPQAYPADVAVRGGHGCPAR